ncbi:MAG TPA: GreA/GreB family elongation factor [Noviherbaspirillum sp.]|nr:GreA/GreB family elongation factor [Noviherbaspirillum sp.]
MKTERYLTQADATVLSRLAEQLLRVREVKFNAGEDLIDLLSTAILLPENSTRKDCVALHTEVTYHTGSPKEKKTLAIVCPQDANQELARVSVLAPLAMALIGREVGSVVDVELPFGHSQAVSILKVHPLSAPACHP